MEYKIQSIVLPIESRYQQCRELFYRGDTGYLNRKNKVLSIGKNNFVDFTTYLNACSYQKWVQYTDGKSVKLYLDAEGDFSVCFLAYKRNGIAIERNEIKIQSFSLKSRQKVCFAFPDGAGQLLGFEVSGIDDWKLYGGYYTIDIPDDQVKDVCLSICTTTFKKESFIKKNISLLRQEILEKENCPDKQNIFVHVVDNGRTLTEQDISGHHVHLYQNKNVGGSGGFARGMIEVLHQTEKKASHILLMDDDVLVLPESILRVYRLLRILKEEYKEYFLSGAMLCYEKMNIQTEDVGFVNKDGAYGPEKKEVNLSRLENILINEEPPYPRSNRYAGWWFCCIPRESIEKNGLPLPLFVRGDDVEFSLRNKADFLTMNGLCVWHMGFSGKFSPSMELYQVHRNSLIIQAASGVCREIDFINRLKKMFRSRILGLDYMGAEQVLDAIEDYLQGPKLIEEDRGEEVLKRQSSKNEKLEDLGTFSEKYDYPMSKKELERNPPRKMIHTLLYRFTYNGHRFCPNKFLSDRTEVIPYGWFYSPERFYLKNQILSIDPNSKKGTLHKRNKKKYIELKKRYTKLMKIYKKKGAFIADEYKKQFSYLTSEKFWRKYLTLEN